MKIHKNKQKGLSLIELLIAMAIGMTVMAGVFQVYMSTKSSNKTLIAEAAMQENARFAFSIITDIVQEAGNFGCQTSNNMTHNSLVKGDNTFRPERVIEGWEAKDSALGDTYKTNANAGVSGTSTLHWTTSATGSAQIDSGTKSKKYSDVFKVWYTKKQKTNVSAITAAGLLTFTKLDLIKGDVIVLNDCQTVNFAQVCACEDDDCSGSDTQVDVSPTACTSPGNTAFNFLNINIPTAEVSVLESALFFVGKRGTGTTGYQKNSPSLYVRHLGNDATLGNKEEILEGVESLQVLYGEDTNNNQSPNYYVNADEVSNWANVVSLKISLLLRSFNNNIVKGSQTLAFNGATIKINDTHDDRSDRYLRRVFTSTISLRNRNIGY